LLEMLNAITEDIADRRRQLSLAGGTGIRNPITCCDISCQSGFRIYITYGQGSYQFGARCGGKRFGQLCM
jgi:hypothetical protein